MAPSPPGSATECHSSKQQYLTPSYTIPVLDYVIIVSQWPSSHHLRINRHAIYNIYLSVFFLFLSFFIVNICATLLNFQNLLDQSLFTFSMTKLPMGPCKLAIHDIDLYMEDTKAWYVWPTEISSKNCYGCDCLPKNVFEGLFNLCVEKCGMFSQEKVFEISR